MLFVFFHHETENDTPFSLPCFCSLNDFQKPNITLKKMKEKKFGPSKAILLYWSPENCLMWDFWLGCQCCLQFNKSIDSAFLHLFNCYHRWLFKNIIPSPLIRGIISQLTL